jgi:endonuclease YncB( thermonuclease family)
MVYGKEVMLQTHGKDKYGRTCGDVFLPDGTTVNQALVKDGWCWWYRTYAPGEAKRGLWADRQPMPPWGYQAAPCVMIQRGDCTLIL